MKTAGGGGRSLGELLRDLTDETSALVRDEIALAKAEVMDKVMQARSGGALLVAGAIVCFAGLLVVLDAAVYGLARLMGTTSLPAAAALIVGLVTLAIGMGLVLRGRASLQPRNLVPTRTQQSLERDAELVKE